MKTIIIMCILRRAFAVGIYCSFIVKFTTFHLKYNKLYYKTRHALYLLSFDHHFQVFLSTF